MRLRFRPNRCLEMELLERMECHRDKKKKKKDDCREGMLTVGLKKTDKDWILKMHVGLFLKSLFPQQA